MLMGLRQDRSGIGQALATLALLAILVRALIPPGYMLSAARDGGVLSVTLCTSHGAATALVDLTSGAAADADGTRNDKAPNKRNADAPCVFATAAPLAPPNSLAPLNICILDRANERLPVSVIAPGRGLAAPPPWSTGPPHIA